MKQFTVIFLILISSFVSAQDRKGYYITLENDTVYTSFLKDDFTVSLYEEVKFLNSDSQMVRLKPRTAKGFYFESKGELSSYVSIQTPWNDWYFARFHLKTKLFDVYEGKHRVYILQKPNGQRLFLTDDLGNRKARIKMQEFFADDKDALTALKGLYAQPGYTHRDTQRFFDKVSKLQ